MAGVLADEPEDPVVHTLLVVADAIGEHLCQVRAVHVFAMLRDDGVAVLH